MPHQRRVDHGAIVAAVDGGLTGAAVAAAHGISRERVRQIYWRDRGLPLPLVRGRWCQTCRERRVGSGHLALHESILRARSEADFWARVAKTRACWEWTGGHDPNGYGRASLTRIDPERASGGYVHRLAYLLTKGAIPKGLTIDHLCRNRGCCNPAHLEAVSQRENILRSPIQVAAINARKTHCAHGHEFDEGNTALVRGGRRCRSCIRDRERAATAARRAARSQVAA